MLVERYFDLSAAPIRMLSPFTGAELAKLGDYCELRPGQSVLDVACGKGEVVCRWAHEFGIGGVGVDISEAYVAAARARAAELDVSGTVSFEAMDASTFVKEEATLNSYDVVSCIGGCRYLGELGPAVALLRECVKPQGLLVIGEPYWIQPPPDEAYQAIQAGKDEYTTLVGTLERLEQAGLEVVDMMVAEPQSYDRVWAPQWRVMTDWLRDNPDHPDAQGFRQIRNGTRRSYLAWGRDYFGFVTFVCRPS